MYVCFCLTHNLVDKRIIMCWVEQKNSKLRYTHTYIICGTLETGERSRPKTNWQAQQHLPRTRLYPLCDISCMLVKDGESLGHFDDMLDMVGCGYQLVVEFTHVPQTPMLADSIIFAGLCRDENLVPRLQQSTRCQV